MKGIFIVILSFISILSMNAQGLSDALRYSDTRAGGTARTIGAGGAFGALGGDFGSLAINPAGLGVYRTSEFIVSPGLFSVNAQSQLSGTNFNTTDNRSAFGLENIGLVISNNPIASDWSTSNFAIGFNKIANFNREYGFNGATIGTITESWIEQSNGLSSGDLDPYGSQLAFIAGAIFDFDGDNFYNSDLDALPDQQVEKGQFIEQSGGINELSLSWGGNYNEKVNIGLGIGIPFVSFRESRTYFEEDPGDEIPVFNELEYFETLNTTGTGFNFKAGMIYTPTRLVRVGLAIHSPTWYFLTDDYDAELTYDFTDGNGNQRFTEIPEQPGTFRYRLNAPWKAIASIGSLFQFGEVQGFVSADAEYRDYASNNFNLTAYSDNRFDQIYELDLNEQIDDILTSSLIFRLGSEIALEKLRFRAGARLEQSPFAEDNGTFNTGYSFGVGFREDKFFLDLAYAQFNTAQGYYPYVTSDITRDPFVISDFANRNITVTAGFKF